MKLMYSIIAVLVLVVLLAVGYFIFREYKSNDLAREWGSTDMTVVRAQGLAAEQLAPIGVEYDEDLVLLPEKTAERSFGWVFFYTTREHAESGDEADAVPGLGPLIVDRKGGVHRFSSSVSPERMIDEADRVFQEGLERLHQEHSATFTEYALFELAPVQGEDGIWLIRFDRYDMEDAMVERKIDAETGEVTEYRGAWS